MSKQPKCDFCHRFLGKNRIETIDDSFPTPIPKTFCSQNCNDNYYSDGYHWKCGENPTRHKPSEDSVVDVSCPTCHKEFEVPEIYLYESEKSLTPIYCSPKCAGTNGGCFVRTTVMINISKRSNFKKTMLSLTQNQVEAIVDQKFVEGY
jgi:hypothetical protein